jgi:hypothetical protein
VGVQGVKPPVAEGETRVNIKECWYYTPWRLPRLPDLNAA